MNKSFSKTLFEILIKRFKLLSICFSVICVGSFIFVLFVLEKQYTSKSTIRLKNKTIEKTPSDLVKGMSLLEMGTMADKQSSIALALLGSRELALKMVMDFDLMKRYKEKWLHLTIEKFRENLEYQYFPDAMVDVNFTYPNRDTSKIVVDSIIAYLNKKMIEMSTENSKIEFHFLRWQVDSLKKVMDKLGKETIGILKEYRIVDVENQGELVLKQLADLESELIQLKAQRSAMKKGGPASRQALPQMEEMINSLQNTKKSILGGTYEKLEKTGTFNISYDSVLVLEDKLRKIKNHYLEIETAIKFLLPQTFQAQLKMLEINPVLYVIDPSYIPVYKSKPKRAFWIIGMVLIGAILLIFVVFTYDVIVVQGDIYKSLSEEIKKIRNS